MAIMDTPRCQTHSTEYEDALPSLTTATEMLRKTLSLAIALDGGSSLATSLKDYIIPDVISNNKRLDHLILQSLAHDNNNKKKLVNGARGGRQPKAKLLAFIELQPDVFHVDRTEIPHWVSLVLTNDNKAFFDDIFREAANYIASSESQRKQKEHEMKLFEKITYVIRRNHARTERRRAKRQLPTYSNTDIHHHQDFPSVNLLWLLRECTWEFHFWARESGVYLPVVVPSSSSFQAPLLYPKFSDVKRVGSKEWEDAVVDKLKHLLVNSDISTVYLDSGRVCLRHYDGNVEHNDGFNVNCDIKKDQDFRSKLDRLLTEIVVERDGGHQVSLSLLLTRYDDLRVLLGGRDLWKLYQQYSSQGLFQHVRITQYDNELLLQSKIDKTSTPFFVTNEEKPDVDTVRVDFIEQRMLVDEVGKYSLANGKWGKAMANILVHAIEKIDLYSGFSDDRGYDDKERRTFPCRLVVDLTAGVGGMTLGLAKTRFFDKVIASEIDDDRARLCQQNMIKHGLDDIVEVRNTDSNVLIRTLPKQVSFVIDCPWGGYGYKKKGGELFLGDTPLDVATENIVHHCTRCIIGLRLPVTFDVNGFLDSLKKRGLELECMSVNKLQVQLFVVLYSACDDQTNVDGCEKWSFLE